MFCAGLHLPNARVFRERANESCPSPERVLGYGSAHGRARGNEQLL